MNLTIEAKIKYQETGTGPFRRLVWWGGEGPLATKKFCLGISQEGHLQFEATEESALPTVPTLMGIMPSVSGTRAVRVHGHYAFVNSGSGVTVVDVSNETVLTMISTLPVLMNCLNLALSADGTKLVLTGTRQYYDEAGAIQATNCFYVVDVSVPTSPRLLGVLETADFGFGAVALSGTRAYVTSATAGLKVVNWTNPAEPVDEGEYDAEGGDVKGVMVVGNYAYLADRNLGLVILNISNPASPTHVISYATHTSPYRAANVFVIGSLAYVGGGNSVAIVDVSTPTAPVRRGTITNAPAQLIAANNVAYLAVDTTGLVLWDVSNPASPTPIPPPLAPTGGPNPTTLGLCLDPGDSSLVLCANSGAGLALVRTAPVPPHPTQLVSIAESFSTYSVRVLGDLMIAGGTRLWNGGYNSSFGLRLLRNRAAPYLVGKYDTTAFGCNEVAIHSSGLYAYVGAGVAGVKVFDISNELAPTPVEPGYKDTFAFSIAATASSATDLITAVNHGFIADEALILSGGTAPSPLVLGTRYYARDIAGDDFKVASVPGNPAIGLDTNGSGFSIQRPLIAGFCNGIALAGNYAYVAYGQSGLIVLDISNPTAPVEVGRRDTPGNAKSVVVVGTKAYVADNTSLQIIDVTNPFVPAPLGSYTGFPSNTCLDVAVNGNTAYIAADINGMRILDVTNPLDIQERSTIPPPAGINPTTTRVAVEGNRACMSNGPAGLGIYDVTDPAAPVKIALMAGLSGSLVMDDGWLYVGSNMVATIYLGTPP